ncbi:hypothetical protein [Treponema sp. J25]|uniref:hypothetical protein n=1 Tax=Treponema sp. J25 TaxID=2094121 RepID=UPI00104AD7B5|nr:hypothetical protein [Treponema sp. J25]MCX7656084.1 GNAT family N-acetyltransferase [Treponemataceae bacterium]TCW62199.1 hypothetical protein C5O22_02915 [Treponema sp. J25]
MILTILAFILPLGLLFLVDLDTYIVTSAFLYGLLLCYRYAKNQRYILDIVFFIVYLTLTVIQIIFGIQRFIPFTGSVIYATLSIVFFISSIGVPLTNDNRKPLYPEILIERSIGNSILSIMNFLAFTFSIVLFPSILYIIVPLVFSLSSIPISVFLSPFIIDKAMEIRARFIISEKDIIIFKKTFGNLRGIFWISDSLYAKEVMSEAEREMFFSVLEKGYFSIFQKSQKRDKDSYTEFIDRIRKEYTVFARYTSAFIVYDTKTQNPVGCIRLVVGENTSPRVALPLETYLPVSLTELQKSVGCIAEAGRLVIIPSGPLKAKVLELLVSLMMVKALLRRVRIIITDAMEGTVGLYEKMGLVCIGGPFFDTEFFQNSWLCAVDVADFLSKKSDLWDRLKNSPQAQKTIARYMAAVENKNRYLYKKNKPFLAVGEPISSFIKIDEDKVLKKEGRC